MAAADRFPADEYLPRHNARFARPPEEAGTAFVPFAGLLEDILCVREERQVGNDNTVRDKGRVLQIPADRHRRHHVKAHVRVHDYPDGTLAVCHAPRRRARYSASGTLRRTQPTGGGVIRFDVARPVDLMDNAAALPTTPQAPQPQQKRSIHLFTGQFQLVVTADPCGGRQRRGQRRGRGRTRRSIRAPARAHRWQRLLEEGKNRPAGEIAEAEGLSRSFVSRLLRLTLLAPDIVEAILGDASRRDEATRLR
jgi:hypothetical protein